ncbi:hypothetical protein SAMN04488564_103192 [Lentzea waywayandensis]|uniref:DUF3592 domain-containing protein n=1 Tax=Lentzea waywayandensis TaxID=84724 RepID=A0A1I6DVX8_9PSEU|nr:hypothetical protein [Lentzea waywayandensis]SFR09654.1 hypothetical protein SAMN04488564_103192 [Lentzea waywayandensis]
MARDNDREASESDNMIAAIAIVVGVVLLAIAIPMAPKAFRIGFSLGTVGTYTVGDVPECSFRCYTRTGTFVSDDGKVTLSDVHVRNGMPRGLQRGDTIRAFDIGAKGEVFTEAGEAGYPYAVPVILGVVGVAGLGLGLQHLWATRRRRT